MKRVIAQLKRLGEYMPGAMWEEISTTKEGTAVKRKRYWTEHRTVEQIERHRAVSKESMRRLRARRAQGDNREQKQTEGV